MHSNKTIKSQKILFTEDQIRTKAYAIWQKQKESSPQNNWDAAIEELKAEKKVTLSQKLWRLTGFWEKTLWDFMQLMIVPLVLAIAGFQLQEFAKAREQRAAAVIAQRERAAATDKAQQEILVKYLDQMIDSVKTDDLLSSPLNKKAFLTAQVRTVTALQSLNSDRQRAVIEFLRTANLYNPSYGKSASKTFGVLHIARMENINLQNADLVGIDLEHSDLRSSNLVNANLLDANLENADLSKANLSGVDLRYAILKKTSLRGANLQGAILRNADLKDADLKDANLQNADLNLADLSRIRNSSISQIKSAKNWQTSKYNPAVRRQLGLSRNSPAQTTP
jgi:uncharacterized protein YjbI with pentapeptide repeats